MLSHRALRPGIAKRTGYVLDDPVLEGDVLHTVFCPETQRVYSLATRTYREVMQVMDHHQRNLEHQLVDATLKMSDKLIFTHDEDLAVVDFVRDGQERDLLTYYGQKCFRTRAVFNEDLTAVFTEMFGQVAVNSENFHMLEEFPTPNVEIFCYFTFEVAPDSRLDVSLLKLLDVNPIDQSFVWQAPWNKSRTGAAAFGPEDDEVELEIPLGEKIGITADQAALITGLTSVFLPDLPHLTALLPKYNKYKNMAGMRARVDLLYSDFLNAHIVIEKKLWKGRFFRTFIPPKPSEALSRFTVDIYSDDNRFGFYTEPSLHLVADPLGFLDVIKYFGQELSAREKHFELPISDRLGGLHDKRQLADLGMVTRFEIVGTGDPKSQAEVVESIKKPMDLKSGGVVVDEKQRLVYSQFFHGCAFYLPKSTIAEDGTPKYKTGDTLMFRAIRVDDPDFIRPTFQIISHQVYTKKWMCEYKRETKEFIVEANYNKTLHCFESETFGYIPAASREEPPKPKSEEQFPYFLSASINDGLYAQTVLFRGRVHKVKPSGTKP